METFQALTLRGDVVHGIALSEGQVLFRPRWGLTRHDPGPLAVATDPTAEHVATVHVACTPSGIVLAPCDGVPSRELVLLQEYAPGVGAKRSPRFAVTLGPGTTILASARTAGGSGGETWSLVTAPLGWAAKVAAAWSGRRQ